MDIILLFSLRESHEGDTAGRQIYWKSTCVREGIFAWELTTEFINGGEKEMKLTSDSSSFSLVTGNTLITMLLLIQGVI